MDSATSGPSAAPSGPGPDRAAAPGSVEAPPSGSDSWVGRRVRGRAGGTFGRLTEVATGPDGTSWGVVRPRLGSARAIPLDGAAPDGSGVTVPIDRRTLRSAPAGREPAPELARHYASHGALSAAHEYQHERFGGFKVGSAFFGWLVAVGLTVLLAALASLVVRLTGISPNLAAAPGQDPRMLGITGGIVAVVVMLLAYVAGGYVAGRLARFDGARNGFAVWAMGVVVTAAVTIAIAVTGTTEPPFAALRVPGIALSGSSLSWSSAIAIVVVAAVALVGAIAGGKAGESYHRRVDRAAEKAL